MPILRRMNVEILSVGPFEVNCAIVWGGAKQALVIDPGLDAADIEAVLRGNGLTVAAYLLTHGHADHLCALDELHAARPSPVYIHAEDFKWAFGAQNQIPPYYPVPGKPATEFIHPEKLAPHNPPRPAGTPPTEGNLKDPLHGRGGRGNATDGVGLITIADLN
ncbi:MAG: MBL fold metallo-hydrolase, partial [Kiritimatiellales bacterium]